MNELKHTAIYLVKDQKLGKLLLRYDGPDIPLYGLQRSYGLDPIDCLKDVLVPNSLCHSNNIEVTAAYSITDSLIIYTITYLNENIPNQIIQFKRFSPQSGLQSNWIEIPVADNVRIIALFPWKQQLLSVCQPLYGRKVQKICRVIFEDNDITFEETVNMK